MCIVKSSQVQFPRVAHGSILTARHHVNARPARNVTATFTCSLSSMTPHTVQYCDKLNSQFYNSRASPSYFSGLSNFNYAAVLPYTGTACAGVADAVAVATAVKAVCHLWQTSATIS